MTFPFAVEIGSRMTSSYFLVSQPNCAPLAAAEDQAEGPWRTENSRGKRWAKKRTFDAQVFLDSAGSARKAVAYRRQEVIFAQGERRQRGHRGPCWDLVLRHISQETLAEIDGTTRSGR
jgi:hypothetical protein